MKKIWLLPLFIALSILPACQKQQTEVERQAEVDREVQRRLDAEHQSQEKEKLDQREQDVAAREKAVSERNTGAVSAVEPEGDEDEDEGDEPSSSGGDNASGDSYDTFYTKLDSYGDWRETDDYGYVFQPRQAAVRTWRPYTDGRWVYTDVGWTWISEEPFGWACYHYGRWTRLRNIGWVWVPGAEWAPAWVSWRKSSDYIGWAPLPPEARFDRRKGIHNWADSYYDIGPEQYCFVSTREFGEQRLERTVIPVERNVTVINQTINVTNITYSNTKVVNQGPNFDELRTRTQRPIERLRLERNSNVNINVSDSRPVIRGDVVAIQAPMIRRAKPVQRPPKLKETVSHVVVERGWDATDRNAAEQARVKMRAEATPPSDAPSKKFIKPAKVRTAQDLSTKTSVAPTQNTAPTETPVRFRPTATPFRSATPVPTLTATATPPPAATATPLPVGTPRPTFTPFRTIPPSATPLPSVDHSSTPPVAGTPVPQATFGAQQQQQVPVVTATPVVEERKTRKEERREQKQERREERQAGRPLPGRPVVTPTPGP